MRKMSPEHIFMKSLNAITKSKVIKFADFLIEWSFYTLIFAVTFSISVVEIASTVMIVAWILKMILARDFKFLNIIPVRILLVFFLWNILSCFNSGYFSESFRGIFKVAEYGMIFIIMATGKWNRARIKRFVYLSVLAVMLVSLNGFFQYFTGEDLIRHRTLTPEDYLKRISSSFRHPNDLGAYLMAMSVMLVSLMLSKRNKIKDFVLYSVPLLLALTALYLTGSRGAWVSFVASFLMVGILKNRKIAAVFVALLIAIFMFMPFVAKERIYGLFDFQSGTTWERLKLWEGATNMVKEHPVLGFGVNTYSKHFPRYKPEGYVDDRYAHNCYLQMAAEIGVPGAVIFIVFLVTVLVFALKGILSMPDEVMRSFSVGLLAGVTGFALNSVVDTHLYSVTLAVFFYMLLGFCFAVSSMPAEDKQQ
jgi:putative inorganic carbon (hco3(-)) transporter